MVSASEAECAALFINTREAIVVKTILEERGQTQPATPIQAEKSTCHDIMNCKIQQKISKSMDMQFFSVRNRAKQ